MGRSDPIRLQLALHNLHAATMRERHLDAEAQAARREFFGPQVHAARTPTAEQRFLEWFLLERESARLGAPPRDVVECDDDSAELLADSFASVFSVAATAGEQTELRDLQDDDAYEVSVPEGALQRGDLVVGRLHPDPAGGYVPSAALAVYRPGQALAAAFQRDLGKLELDRRLTQLELEQLLLARTPGATGIQGPPLEHLEARLDSLLRGSGSQRTAGEVSEALAQAVRPGAVLGPLLDELAFETAVDLDRARTLLLELWNAHHADAPLPPAPGAAPSAEPEGPPGETLGERLVRTLDQGLAQKRDVEELFAQLEAMAGIEPGEEEDEDDDPIQELRQDAAAAGGDVGDLAPLVQEYLWETGRGDTAEARLLTQWTELQQNAAVPHIDLESVTSQDLMRLLLHVYLGAEPAERARAVRTAFASLCKFYGWAETTQEMALRTVLDECQGTLLDQLDRLQAAGLALSGSLQARGGAGASILQVEQVAADGFGVIDDDGNDHWIQAPAATAALLRAGDLLLGTLQPSARGVALQGLVVALPKDAKALIG